jgi:hypothetical protein
MYNEGFEASKMRFLRSVKGCKKEDKIRNEEIREELRIYISQKKIRIIMTGGWSI